VSDLEDLLRSGLRAAADEGPAFVAPDLSEVSPERRRRRWPALLAAASAVVAGGAAWTVLQQSGGSGDASCAFVLDYDGRRWSPVGSDRTPVAGGLLGEGVLLGCDDGNGASPDETVEVRRVRGVDPTEAISVDGELLLPQGATGLPEALRDASEPVRCDLEGPVELAGRWEGIRSPAEPRFDGDVRLPYSIDFRTSDERVTDGYASVLLQARATAQTARVSPEDVKALLWEPAPSVLTTHCEDGRFVMDAIDPAD
jgi:hypothetical protein